MMVHSINEHVERVYEEYGFNTILPYKQAMVLLVGKV
jgi:hypothetical protein